MAKIIVITNNKGGCGKTTTALNLAAAFRLHGLDTLAVDLDGQRSLSVALGVEASPNGTVYTALKASPAPFVQPVEVQLQNGPAGALDLLPASCDLSALEIQLGGASDRTERIKEVLDKYRHLYSIIIVDTPPALGALTIGALYAADAVIVTSGPEPLALNGLANLRDSLRIIESNRREPLPSTVLLTQMDRRLSLHKMTADAIRANFPTFSTEIRKAVAIAESPAAQQDIFEYAPRSKGAEDYGALAAECLQAWKLRLPKKRK